MLIFVLQTIWLYIKELAGKDLDMVVVLKFLFYFSPKLIPLVLPLTILLASIMVFGSFAENYEFAAMKSTGISLQRAMAGLSIFIVALGFVTFLFSNSVIPWAEYHSYNLRKNIAKLKPSMAIAEGQFNDVMDYNIKVDKKSGDRGQFLEGVVMHKKSNNGGNHTLIISKTGEFVGKKDSEVLKFILYDGYFYDDTPPKNRNDRLRRPMTKSYFEKYTINIDLSQLNNQSLDEKNISDKYNMLNVSDLNYSIDSLQTSLEKDYSDFATSLYNRTNMPVLNTGLKQKKDTIFNGEILSLFSNKKKVQMIKLALNSIKSSKQIVTIKEKQFKERSVLLNKHIIALHEKLALGFACVILFFVGAPLGALIRKGGIGLPMVVAIFLFLTYHFIGIFAKNSAKDGTLDPILASWFSTLVMLPLGYYLTKRATADRGLFEFDYITEPLKKLLKIKPKSDSIIKRKLTIQERLKPEAEAILNKQLPSYKAHSRITFIFYSLGVIFFVLYFVFKNNELPEFAESSIQLSVISLIVYSIYFIKSYLNSKVITNLCEQLQQGNKNPLILILNFIFYPITHFLRKDKITEVVSISSK